MYDPENNDGLLAINPTPEVAFQSELIWGAGILGLSLRSVYAPENNDGLLAINATPEVAFQSELT